MRFEKVKCIYCNKKIKKNLDYCSKCGRDIRSMWQTETSDELEEVVSLPLFCPNPRCHAPYTEGDLFCIQCRNDYGKNPPVPEKINAFPLNESSEKAVYCPECGTENNENDMFCDCGCDFRIHPKIAVPPVKKIFYCAVCNQNQVQKPDEICKSCKQTERKRSYLCPECKKNKVKTYGEICMQCIRKKPMRGMGEGFHIAK